MFGIFSRVKDLERRVERLEVNNSGERIFHEWIHPYLLAELDKASKTRPEKKRGRPRKTK